MGSPTAPRLHQTKVYGRSTLNILSSSAVPRSCRQIGCDHVGDETVRHRHLPDDGAAEPLVRQQCRQVLCRQPHVRRGREGHPQGGGGLRELLPVLSVHGHQKQAGMAQVRSRKKRKERRFPVTSPLSHLI